MKAVILAGGLGTRISEETHLKPKPMIEIGGKPILWHIMKIYGAYGINEFIICCGYRGYVIKEYFSNYLMHMSDVTHDLAKNETVIHNQYKEPWKVTLVDTGELTMTGGRLKRVEEYLKEDDTFCFTYGDGLSDVNIKKLIHFHNSNNCEATLTAVYPPGRFGALVIKDNYVSDFKEKPKGDGNRINGGFFILNKSIFRLLQDDTTVWEHEPLEILAKDREISAYTHDGFWQPMDTLRDKHMLDTLWASGNPPWKVW